MGGYVTLGQSGGAISRQARKALSRHSSIHAGSCFFSEMRRTTSSLSPLGRVSASISVTKPYLYSCVASSSIVVVGVLIACPGTYPDRIGRLLEYTTGSVGDQADRWSQGQFPRKIAPLAFRPTTVGYAVSARLPGV